MSSVYSFNTFPDISGLYLGVLQSCPGHICLSLTHTHLATLLSLCFPTTSCHAFIWFISCALCLCLSCRSVNMISSTCVFLCPLTLITSIPPLHPPSCINTPSSCTLHQLVSVRTVLQLFTCQFCLKLFHISNFFDLVLTWTLPHVCWTLFEPGPCESSCNCFCLPIQVVLSLFRFVFQLVIYAPSHFQFSFYFVCLVPVPFETSPFVTFCL